jgi:hypothetical protein
LGSGKKGRHSLVLLDNNGGAVLAVGDLDIHKTVRFLISIKVLSLASPVFTKMFGPNFQGHKIHCGETIQFRLGDNDALAIEVILKAPITTESTNAKLSI